MNSDIDLEYTTRAGPAADDPISGSSPVGRASMKNLTFGQRSMRDASAS